MLIHFWSKSVSEHDVADWDPDRAPTRFSSGVGHNLLELFVRMRERGLDVELGARASARPDLVVIAAPSLYWEEPRNLPSALDAIARARGRFVLIRSDVPRNWTFPVRPLVEVMPNRASVSRPHELFLPALPQRGLIPRDRARPDTVRRVALKANRENVPGEVADGSLARALVGIDVELWIDTPATPDGSDNQWHDFADVDAVLCWRPRRRTDDPLRKPATKLVNAWSAGCIPVGTGEPGYLELATPGVDFLVADDVASIVETIRAVNADAALAGRLFEASRLRGEELSSDAIATLWARSLRSWAATGRTRSVSAMKARVYRCALPALRVLRDGVRQLRGRYRVV